MQMDAIVADIETEIDTENDTGIDIDTYIKIEVML